MKKKNKMKNRILAISLVLMSFFVIAVSCNANNSSASNLAGSTGATSVYDFTMKDIDGKDISLSQYKGKIIVIVNTASKCGLVGQLAEIEAFHKKYKDKGIVVLGFPEGNFLGQEFDDNAEIKAFCTKNYGVTFQMFSKISVKGKDIHPLYQYLTSKSENGVIDAPIKWNYQKFIIDRNGKVVSSVPPRTTVNDQEFMQYIEDLLK
jgi:glutathione peroxidase